MNSLLNEKYHIRALIILSLVLFFLNIHSIPLTDGDSAFYAKIAKNMAQSGNWLTLHYGDAGTIINKPPLMIWLTAASFKAFGFNDFAASLWHSLFALLTVLFTYQIAKELFNKKTAFVSSLILATTAQFFYQARSPLQDIPLTLFILLSVYSFVLFSKYKKIGYFYLVPVFISLATLTKGPVGLALPAIILCLWIWISNKKLPGLLHILTAMLIFFTITAPWFVAEYRILGQKFLDVLIGDNFGRYLKPIDTIGSEAIKYKPISPQFDFYSYFLQILLLMIPWSGFIYPAVYSYIKKNKDALPVIFVLSVVIFFSLSLNYKISRYILPAYPALAIILGHIFVNAKDRKYAESLKLGYLINALLVLPILILSTVMLYNNFSRIGQYYLPLLLPFLIIMSLGLLAGSILGLMKKHEHAFYTLIIASIVSYIALTVSLDRYYAKLNPISDFCRQINTIAKPDDLVCQYKGTDAHFMIYYSKADVKFIRDEAMMKVMLRSRKKVYCVTENEEAYRELISFLKGRIKELGKSSNYTLFSN